MDRQAHLTSADMRRKLLDHAADPTALMTPLDKRSSEVDSEFERLVLRELESRQYRVVPQWKVGSYRIDLVVEGKKERLAVECDGDRYHTLENLEADMRRQAVLERLGWRFIRLRGSEFFRDSDKAMRPLYERLERMEIYPMSAPRQDLKDDLCRRVIAEAKNIRDEWNTDIELLDEILGRNRSARRYRETPEIQVIEEVPDHLSLA
jgi:very-short-patch-repair endonuclease